MVTYLRGAALSGTLSGLLLAGCAKDVASPSQPAPVAAPGNGPNATVTNGVMLQGFYWDVPQSSSGSTWWQVLSGKASEFSTAGFTAVWLPPASKGGSASDVGYGIYDRYDLGEFNQKGTVATRYGTLSQLQSCITALHSKGIQVYEDLVMNHLAWADAQETVNGNTVYTKFNYSGRGTTYSNYQWRYYNFNGTQQAPNNGWYQWNAWDFQPYANNDAYDNLLGCEIRYADVNQQNETIAWGNWITGKLSLDGYRLDATKHISTPFLNKWLDAVKGTSGRFAVSEAWFRNLGDLNNDGSSAASKGITSPFKSATLTDKTGNYAGTVTTNASGYGTFPVNGRSWSVWVPN